MTPRFEVQSFEQVPAGPGTVLLRIAGRWIGPSRERLPMPLLLLDDGRRTHRLSPLPGPEDAAPHWMRGRIVADPRNAGPQPRRDERDLRPIAGAGPS